jgi:hypothetical protein
MQPAIPDPSNPKTPAAWPRWLKLIAWSSPLIAASAIATTYGEIPGFFVAAICLAGFVPVVLVTGSWRIAVHLWKERGPVMFRLFWAIVVYGGLLWLACKNPGFQKVAGAWTTECVVLLLLVGTALMALAVRPGWFFSRRGLARMLFGAACLATLVALFYAEENWRGRRAWERFKGEWEAKGIKFDLAAVTPPPIPDEQNVAMHPLFKPVFDYTVQTNGPDKGMLVWRDTNAMTKLRSVNLHSFDRVTWTNAGLPYVSSVQEKTNGIVIRRMSEWQKFYRRDTNFAMTPFAPSAAEDVLLYLKRHDAVLAELDDALKRPRTHFPFRSDESLSLQPYLPHLASLKSMTTVLALRAESNLEAGRTEDALRDVERSFRLNGLLDEEPLLMSQLVQIAMQTITLGAVAHGTADHRWEERQLVRLDELLRPVNKFSDFVNSLRGEAAFAAGNVALMQRDTRRMREYHRTVAEMNERYASLRKDWSDFDRKFGLGIADMVIRHAPVGWFDEHAVWVLSDLLSSIDDRFVDSNRCRISVDNKPRSASAFRVQRWWPFPPMTGASWRAALKAARLQSNFHQARIAVALERHWLRHRAYPERLDALVPEFLDRIPHDIFDGQPMRYRREGEQGFVLWSIGFDGVDGNASPLAAADAQGVEGGDLVWRYPVKE